jgi:membrane protease YdiL (CAAX protease family)
VSAPELRQPRARHAIALSAVRSTWALSLAVGGIVLAEALVAFGNNISGSIACGLVLDGLVVGCVVVARGPSTGRHLPPLAAALLALSLIPMERLASLALPAHEIPRSAWPAVVGVVVLIGAWRITPLAGLDSLRSRLRPPVRGDALLAACAVPVGALWFATIHPADARIPHGALAIAGAAILIGVAVLAEELVFRGVLLDVLTRARVTGGRSRVPVESAAANVVASVVYAAASLGWPMPYPIFAFLAALVLGRTALRRRSVTGVAVAHFVAWSVAVFLAPALFGASTAGFLIP